MNPKYMRLASDIHLDCSFTAKVKSGQQEFDKMWSPVPLPEDEETVYVIAGDLWQGTKAFDVRYGNQTPWIVRIAERFHTVIFVAGNHDYWGENLRSYTDICKQKIEALGLKNVFVLQDDELVINNTKFLGGTLWTDFYDGNPMVMMVCQNSMNDYRNTRAGGHQMRPYDTLEAHRVTRDFFVERARRDYPGQKVVIVAHHLPSYQSVHEQYRNRTNFEINFAYFSDLDTHMYDPEFACDLFCHGHSHTSADYMIDRTRVVCNPRGYGATSQNPDFDETWRIEL